MSRTTLAGNRWKHATLPDGATVVVVGGGPAGAFFAIRVLRKARDLGRKLNVLILEKKKELSLFKTASQVTFREGCNYCAGSISPRMADALRNDGFTLPEAIVAGKVESLTVHGDWKSIELPIPAGREILNVFRGSRPGSRPGRHVNFDSYLLDRAVEEGAKVITGEARDFWYSPSGKPVVSYRVTSAGMSANHEVEADFAVFSGGVNQTPGMGLKSGRLFQALARAIPGFRPPKVRRALICEMQAEEGVLRHMRTEMHFAQHGSKDLRIEMSSLIPKGNWMTVVLVGQSIDRAEPSEHMEVMKRFLELPHIRRLLPKDAELTPVCVCNPNIAVGRSRTPYGRRIAIIGDMVVSRLYKDGIFSAYVTASALADCLLDIGIDEDSLKRGHWPVVNRLAMDNKFGEVVFFLNRVTFSRPVFSRIAYQAVLTERKTKPEHKRRLANVLWRIASGDDTYRNILLAMLHPATVWLIFVGGVLVTIRNYVTERVFGLKWAGFGRYPTGVFKENLKVKRQELADALGSARTRQPPHFERMYSIKLKADRAAVLRQLGKFGDSDRRYFKPRFIHVRRTTGLPNEIGSTIQYVTFPRRLSFILVLAEFVSERYLVYRVRSRLARGGILAFDVDEQEEGICLLSLYVAFDFPSSKNPFKSLVWRLFRLLFPGFLHDVVWNHSLCELKHVLEKVERPA